MEKETGKCSNCNEDLTNYSISTEYYSFFGENKKISKLLGFICHKCAMKESGVSKLYHLSNSCEIVDEFIPRIPSNRADGEDSKTPRLSLSSSIEGCLTAVPWGNSRMEQLYYGDYDSTFLIRVYEFDVCDLDIKQIIPPDCLYFSDLVRDANATQEHWYIGGNLKPSKSYLIEVNNHNEVSEDSIICKNLMDYFRAERNENNPIIHYDEIMEGCFTRIEDIKYEVIPETRRSGLFKLNHEIAGVKLDDLRPIELDVLDLYPLEDTWVKLVEKDKQIYIKGEIDTRWTGNFEYSGEIDSIKMIDYVNQNLKIGEIINQ